MESWMTKISIVTQLSLKIKKAIIKTCTRLNIYIAIVDNNPVNNKK